MLVGLKIQQKNNLDHDEIKKTITAFARITNKNRKSKKISTLFQISTFLEIRHFIFSK